MTSTADSTSSSDISGRLKTSSIVAISTPIDGRVCADGIGITRCMFIKTYFKSSNQDWEETANYFKVSGLQVDRRTLLISHNINPIISPTLECIKFDDRKI